MHYELQLCAKVVDVMNGFIDKTHADTVSCSTSLIDVSDFWPGVMWNKTGAKRRSFLIEVFFGGAQTQIIC